MKWNSAYQEYIDQYKDLAIEQMQKYRIPASITLAQGVFESGAGRSELTRKGNNHFGIKCHGWTGRTTYHDDDAKGECFRAYKNAYESYEDHSKFLASGQRYRSLFKLSVTDYKGWARGLKAAGYATNPRYATIVTYLIQKSVLDPFGLQYLQTIAFILVIAALVQMVEIVMKKVSPALYQALGIFLPLITTNCAVLGVAILVIQKDFTLLESVVYAFSTAIGFGLALTVFAGIREQLELVNVPKGMRGVAITMVTAGLLSLAFMGFSGVDGGLKTLFGLE